MTQYRVAGYAIPAQLVQLLRFGVAGVLGLLADVAVLYLLLALGLGWYAGRLLSFLAAVWVTWQFNRRYTFNSGTPSGSLWQEWWRYLTAMLGGGAVNYAGYLVVLHLCQPRPWLPLVAVCAGSVVGMVVNFLSAKFLVFQRG
jgi:putative flippase GtrA